MDPNTSKMCAMKIEYLDIHKSSLKLETSILQELAGCKYFPQIIDHGKTHTIRYLVMEILGASLQNMRAIAPRKRFSMYTTLRIALESLIAIEEFHKHGYVHRDIKPGNFLIRNDPKYPICLIDFGLCRKYIDENGKIIPPRDEPGFTGTCRYASVHAHNYNELGRRDDIISWLYTIVELADSRLPWPGTKDRVATRQMKNDISATTLLKSFPDEILDIYREVRKLKYEDQPDYELYKRLIREAINQSPQKKSGFDWEYFNRKQVEDVSPDLALGPPKQTSAKSLSSTKAFLGPPRKPFVMPDFIPPVFNPIIIPSTPEVKKEEKAEEKPSAQQNEGGCCRIM
ncbi:CK1 family protein kinase [Trichomonas vaginalis G3]|uniref:non-specific serine/threonine protein kinase n=1 Tax=Trichomonas vaginalis (strain ATCC PRA-98 / G3) TaxID=412133 RepID=A2EMS2_TRIV3|nr:protein kinase protein [Trichomonas vaginalis G3]EAY06068.1 CK1 family protein kinase [Trichomonas vaginalis G3]KAI5536582.1 protein kinase protein [Trichomonas vaginalis G3]|eukprot:XP_001318291.1 CK1 family protein kinase [Trichomonas vaginalis G3]